MAIGRYTFTSKIKGGKGFATSITSARIYRACNTGQIEFTTTILRGGERLDTLAANIYGSSSMWWVLAAASGIGWGLQCPPGTLVRIPNNLGAVMQLVR
tara:strand:- start:30107 stop:30403 length:297 start_codon:yes stop_codon:yes gene_type:complete